MPIVKIGNDLVYFAHVPKCGGTSVEVYLQQRFGELAFLDWAYLNADNVYPWNNTSPQHIDLASLARLIPESFFKASFALVRHPVDRMLSVFRYQQEKSKSISENIVFSEWLESLQASSSKSSYIYDNHLRPMDEIVPLSAKVFKLENGTKQIVDWLDEIAGDKNGPREVPKKNTSKSLSFFERSLSRKHHIGAKELKAIVEMYSQDFERFKYSLELN